MMIQSIDIESTLLRTDGTACCCSHESEVQYTDILENIVTPLEGARRTIYTLPFVL